MYNSALITKYPFVNSTAHSEGFHASLCSSKDENVFLEATTVFLPSSCIVPALGFMEIKNHWKY